MSEDLLDDRDDIEELLGEATDDPPAGEAGDAEEPPVEEGVDAFDDVDRDPGYPVYDFRRPYNISRQFEKSLLTVSETFAKACSLEFTSLLRANVNTQSKDLRLSTFGDFVKAQPELSCIATVNLMPLTGPALLQFDLNLAFVLLKRLLGGSIEEEKRVRKFTDIEIAVMDILIHTVLDCLVEANSKLIDMESKYLSLENRPDYLGTLPNGETMIILPFDLDIDGVAGEFNVCIPVTAFESVWHIFDPEESTEYRSPEEIHSDRKRMYGNMLATTAELTVKLGETTRRMEEIRSLQVGDILHLDKHANAPLVLEIEGRPMYRGITGKLNRKRALKITESIEPEE